MAPKWLEKQCHYAYTECFIIIIYFVVNSIVLFFLFFEKKILFSFCVLNVHDFKRIVFQLGS